MENYLDSTVFTSGASYTLLDKIKDGNPDRVFVGNEISASSPSGAKAIFLGLWRFLVGLLLPCGLRGGFGKFLRAETLETDSGGKPLAKMAGVLSSPFTA